MNIIPFDSTGNLPAFLKTVDVAAMNSDLTSHAGGGFPVISIKGKVFAVVRDGEREVMRNPRDPESAASSIDVVMIKANKNTSKVFYIKGYDKDSEGAKPDCYSNDGVAPAADAQTPQAKKCAVCKHNQWGSRVSDSGTSKGKACSDSVRVAVAPAGQLNDPMLLRVPPASIKALGEYGQMLAKRGVGYNMVVTKVGFDLEAESPKLTFKPVGLLDDPAFEEASGVAQSDTVANILGAGAPVAVAPQVDTPEEDAAEVQDEPKPEPKPEPKAEKPKAAKPQPKPEPKPEPKVVEDDGFDIDLDDISFDD